MKEYKKRTRCGFALLAALLLMFCSTAAAFAADGASLDFSKTGSVTLTLADGDGETVSGGEITIYEAASLYLDGGDMAYAFTDAFQGCTAVPDAGNTSLAGTLAQYVENNNISGTTASVGTDGTVTFEGLELGLYLIVQTAQSDHYETINPFVVTVPVESGGAWDYSVDASPKVGTVTLTETEEEEEEKTTTATTSTVETGTPASLATLPQTGQLYWPVWVMGGSGAVLLLLGWALRLPGRKQGKYAG